MDVQHERLQKTAKDHFFYTCFFATINQCIVDCVEFFAIFVHCHRKSSILVEHKQNERHWKAFQSHWLSKEWQNDNFMNGELTTKGESSQRVPFIVQNTASQQLHTIQIWAPVYI